MSGPRRLQPGEVLTGIPAGSWNAFCDAWEWMRRNKAGGSPSTFSGANRLVVPVLNDAGLDLTADFPIVQLTEPVINTEESDRAQLDAVSLKGELPGDDTRPDQIAIIQGPVGDGALASGVIVGPAWCKVEFSDESHTHALPVSGESGYLKSAFHGIPIIWHGPVEMESFPEHAWTLVMLGSASPSAAGVGKAGESIGFRESGTIVDWVGEFGSETEGEEIEMFNWGPAVEAGEWVLWQIISNQYAFVKTCGEEVGS